MKQTITIALLIVSTFVTAQVNKWESFNSPNGNVEFVLTTGRQLLYSVKSDHQPVINDSRLGLVFKNLGVVGNNMVLENFTETTINETWEPILSKNSQVINHYNLVHINLKQHVFPGFKLQLIVRIYNDGVAFRYLLDDDMYDKTLWLEDELTSFSFWMNSACWAADYGSYTSHQEAEFVKMSVADVKDDAFVGLPLLAKSGTKYVAIAEAGLKDWAGMYLKGGQNKGKDATLYAHLSKVKSKQGELSVGRVSMPVKSPWRVVMVGARPGDLIESDLIQNLNEPSKIVDPSWIKPGLCAWDNWWSRDVKMDTKNIKVYIDLAAQNKFPYMLIDWHWYGVPDKVKSNVLTVASSVNMPEVLLYAKSKKVKLWLWLNHTDLNRNMEKAFALYQSWGIAGVKIDFMARDDMQMVDWYHKTTALAAKYHLMVNYHGAYKPTGLRRTYPNLMTREGVLGNEYNKWSYRVTPEHNVTIPFTRMLAGPMDYTPGGFQNRGIGEFKPQINTLVMGTRCHELAKFVVYESPITTVCDHPSNYEQQAGMDFLQHVPTVWDETKVLQGEVGEFIVMARRSGSTWYLAGMTNSKGRELSVDYGRLLKGATSITLWKDKVEGKATELIHRTESVSDNQQLLLTLAPGGGFVAIIKE